MLKYNIDKSSSLGCHASETLNFSLLVGCDDHD